MTEKLSNQDTNARANMRVGMTPADMYCIGLSRPIEDHDITEAIRPGLLPYVELNDDGTQTIGFQRKQFGWTEAGRWDDFEAFAQEVASHLGEFVLDLEPRVLKRDQTTLFEGRDATTG